MNWRNLILIVLIIFLVALVGLNKYQKRNWEEIELCNSWKGYTDFNCTSDIYDCKDKKGESNSWMRECLCKEDNSTQKIICTEKIELWRYKI